jgi:ADP-heptose:LPS heptosyltransferase
MKKILIINLRRLGDVYTTGHLVNSITKANGSSVSLLVYKETISAATNLKNVKNLFSIDRKEIITLKSNKLFSDGFALEQLFSQLQEIKNQKWDEIVNYSNDLVGAYICSYLRKSTEKIIGTHFNRNRNNVAGSEWGMLFNDVLPVIKYAPLHFIDCYHKMLNVPADREGEKLLTSSSHNAIAFSNMSTLREEKAEAKSSTKTVGIQLKTSDSSKDIPEEIIIELLTLLKGTPILIPVLLIAPFEDERKYAQEINNHFEGQIAVVESTLQEAASILMNIDILITPDTVVKHIADLTDTPVLEISLGQAPFLKQGSYTNGSLVLTDLITSRSFIKAKNEVPKKTNISAQDIVSSVLYYFTKTKSIRPILSNDVTLYTCSFDHLGARYSVAAGTVDAHTEIHRLMSRQLVNLLYEQTESPEIYSDVTNFGAPTVSNWSKNESCNITAVMKDLLGTLRTLLQSQENKNSSKDFVFNLGKLISHSENNTLVQIPLMMFKAKIESITAKTFEQNAKEVEMLLYELKTDIQKVISCIRRLEEKTVTQRKDDFMKRVAHLSAN